MIAKVILLYAELTNRHTTASAIWSKQYAETLTELLLKITLANARVVSNYLDMISIIAKGLHGFGDE